MSVRKKKHHLVKKMRINHFDYNTVLFILFLYYSK